MSDSVTIDMKGLEATIEKFQLIEDAAFKKRRVKIAERKAGKIYQKEAQRNARNAIDDEGLLADSIKPLRDNHRGSKDWITVKYGAKIKRGKKAKKINGQYKSGGWLAAWYEFGTNERYTKGKGFFKKKKHVGKIKATHFQQKAYNSKKNLATNTLRVELKKVLDKAIRFAKNKGMVGA